MSNRSLLLSVVGAALIFCGIGIGVRSPVAEARAVPQVSYPWLVPGELRLRPTQVDCRFVACRDDSDCAITSCHANGCTVPPATGDGFGRCTVRPQ